MHSTVDNSFTKGACRYDSTCSFSDAVDNSSSDICQYDSVGNSAPNIGSKFDQGASTNEVNSPKSQSVNAENVDGKIRSSHKFSVNAKEFVPSWMRAPGSEKKTYAGACGSVSLRPLCPYFITGECENGDSCMFVHGLVCELCNLSCLHPADPEQRLKHHRECVAAHEKAMEEAFAEARSKGKLCGICMENIRERSVRFGVLEGCRHCFCLDCIRRWRRSQSELCDKKTVRGCPECRTHSDFVIPAVYWPEDAEDKKKLIDSYRENMKQKPCKYLIYGRVNNCPFGNKCFYKHVLPDGTVVEALSPRTLRRRRHPFIADFFTPSFDSYIGPESDSDDDSLLALFTDLITRSIVRNPV